MAVKMTGNTGTSDFHGAGGLPNPGSSTGATFRVIWNPENFTTQHIFFFKDNGLNTETNYAIYRATSTEIACFWGTGGSLSNLKFTHSMTPGNWYDMVFVLGLGATALTNALITVNNVLQSLVLVTNGANANTSVNDVEQLFLHTDGTVAHAAIWNGRLNANEIAALYGAGNPFVHSSLVRSDILADYYDYKSVLSPIISQRLSRGTLTGTLSDVPGPGLILPIKGMVN